MSTLISLLSEYSFVEIFILIVTILICFKFLSELWDWIIGRTKSYFNKKTKEEEMESRILDKINTTSEQVNEVKCSLQQLENRITQIERYLENNTERLQENTRSWIIDKHHSFINQGWIDDLNLMSIERRYMFYKAAGGDTFIDGLMSEIRRLPRQPISKDYYFMTDDNNDL